MAGVIKGVRVDIVDQDKGFAALLKRILKANAHLTVGIHGEEGGEVHRPSTRDQANQLEKDKATAKALNAKNKGQSAEKQRANNKQAKAKADKARKASEAEMPTLAEVAEFHEYGLGVPQRSFIGGWIDETLPQKKKELVGVAKAAVKGDIPSVEAGLEMLGNLYVGQVQKRISDGIAPALSPYTIKMKGSSVPLIDTGQLRSSVTYKVAIGDEKGNKK